MDRYMLAYDLLWSIRRREASFLVRLPSSARPKIIRQFGPGDALVEVTVRSRHRKRQPDMPKRWTLRMITYRPEGGEEDVRLLTDLMPESGFTREELAGLYHERWDEETITDEIKTHLCDCPERRVLQRSGRRGATVNRPVAFRSQTPDRVIQELWGMLIAYNAVRKTMCAAAVRAELDPRRVSFTAALERTRETTYEMMRMPTIRLPGRYDQMLVAMARVVVPKRPGRHLPRVVKIKMSSYPLKRVGRRAG